MDVLTSAGIFIFVVLIAGFIVLVPSVMIFNVKAGIKYRENLAIKLHKLRMGKMLKALNIDVVKYLHQERIVDIDTHMHCCQHCSQTERCDHELSSNHVSVDNIAYCNNEQALTQIYDKQHSQEREE